MESIKGHVYNYHFQPKDRRDHLMTNVPEVKLPRKVDLREKYKVPVFDQSFLGSCTAQASATALQFLLLKLNETLPKEKQFPIYTPSRLFIYANSRILEETPLTEDSGCSLRSACKAIAKFKAPKEPLWEYDISKFSIKPPISVYNEALKITRMEYKAIPQTFFRLRNALYNNCPVIFGMDIYPSFESKSALETGIIPMPDFDKEVLMGGHALVLISYNDDEEMFLVQNSWGTNVGGSFGEKFTRGYFKIPYKYILDRNHAGDFWVLSRFE